jgi:hypothetical protein
MLLILLLVNICATINTINTITVSIIFMKSVSMFLIKDYCVKIIPKVEQFVFTRRNKFNGQNPNFEL